ncbi:MAG: hypothetical protein ACRD5M_02890 [Candidatus Acidiferrales bacterium]
MVRTFESYCDEFGHAKDPSKKYMGIAGLLGWSDDWKRFAEEWEACISTENVPRPFHMVDFIHHAEDFSAPRWGNQLERLRVLNLLLEVIERSEAIPVAAAVSLSDYNNLTLEQQRMCRDPYYLAFQAVTSNLGFAAGSKDLSTKVRRARADVDAEKKGLPLEEWDYATPATVSMLYAKFRGFTGPAEELWNALKAVNMFGYWMASYATGEPLDHPPLQAADIWAYSIGNLGERREAATPEAAIALEVFIRLAMKAPHGHHWFTRLDREQILGRIGRSRA